MSELLDAAGTYGVTMSKECADCGMPVNLGEYHPYAACLMFKGCRDSDEVRAAMRYITSQWRDIGYRKAAEEVRDGNSEIVGALRLVWAAAHGNGGRLEIYDKDIQACTDECELVRFNDARNKCVVFTAKQPNAELSGAQTGAEK